MSARESITRLEAARELEMLEKRERVRLQGLLEHHIDLVLALSASIAVRGGTTASEAPEALTQSTNAIIRAYARLGAFVFAKDRARSKARRRSKAPSKAPSKVARHHHRDGDKRPVKNRP
jgi:hypothetical protein